MSIPGSAEPLLLAQQDTGYKIERSLRFNSSDSAYLSRTPASAGNRKTWTWSGWVKRSALSSSARYGFFGSGNAAGNAYTAIEFYNDTLRFLDTNSGGTTEARITAAVYRDTSAWMHIVLAYDTTQATAANRIKLYTNGTEVTVFTTSSNPALNSDSYLNQALPHAIGAVNALSSFFFFDGYLADVHFIDGQALDPTSFAETNATTGQWVPKAYTGTYGTNGFRLAFADNSNNTATTLGKDTSGNGNNWTPNNLSVTAGAGNDSLVDTPTSYGTDTGAGGEVRGNYCTLNPLQSNATGPLTNGNLEWGGTNPGNFQSSVATVGMPSGKWYAEFTRSGTSGDITCGIARITNSQELVTTGNFVGGTATSYSYYASTGNKFNGASGSSYGAAYADGDTVGIAFDADNGTLAFYKNGVSQGTAFTGLTGTFAFACSAYLTTRWIANFGQRPFAYTAPSGFKALCDTNLPAPAVAKPNSVFDVKLYTGNGSSQTISGLGFSPDLVWIKGRSINGTQHQLTDVVRGTSKSLSTNATGGDATLNTVTSFNSDGFTVGNEPDVNFNNLTCVAWTWDAGSSTVTNTQGSITSQVRANASAGFSIVTYTGNGTSGATVGHGLGVAPGLIIVKQRSTASANGNWAVQHQSLGATKALILSATDAADTSAGYWNNTSPTSSVFSVGTFEVTNRSTATYVAYCFAPVAGYSSFGSYTGNGNTSGDGPFVFCGFRPRYVLIRNVSRTENWIVHDTARDPYNVTTAELIPNSSGAEGNTTPFDILSNGFKIRNTTTNNGINASNETHIYCAFAENSFQYARAR